MDSLALSQELLKVITLFKNFKCKCGSAVYWFYATINFKKYHMQEKEKKVTVPAIKNSNPKNSKRNKGKHVVAD